MLLEQTQFIEFQIDQERYAFYIEDVQEIIKIQVLKQFPHAIPYVKGVINLRGQIVPVVSLRGLFHYREVEPTKDTRIIFVNHNNSIIGVIVDEVQRVASFSTIQPPPEKVGDMKGSTFVGIGVAEDGLVAIIRIGQIL
ncbi:MAG: chemotaxis protein CheW [Candidatus Pristimantibacillus lignocellulolyticus]|uniref:Chemotaxis protein CheW n=1 Tax=Candidatus Pristimantibacillus lignocellulolyticus TaxID=2994561 RepID=A0A9J6ZHK7_9BACL|nr:MAG: chemotaxis protein CheW [Candidatus Pristimantibacillus lignocellulolyticus]